MADAFDFKFDVTLEDHDQFIGGMDITLPPLARRVSP